MRSRYIAMLSRRSLSDVTLRRKRNTALLVAYIGTPYKGLQKQPSHAAVPTIERELERALYESGCIRDSNYGFLDKIGWCGTTGCASRLLHVLNGRVQLNTLLPDEVRVMAAVSVPRSWKARKKSTHRVYEYLIPFDLLPEGNEHDWRYSMASLLGSANVHNFSNGRAPRHSLTRLPFQLTEHELGVLDQAQIDALTFQRDPHLNRTVEDVVVDSVQIRTSRFWRFKITGASFAYNQIRKMIGAIVSVSAGILPLSVVRAAYRGPVRVHVPLAPPDGLLLTYSHGTFPNWRQGPEIDYLTQDMQALCDGFKHDVIYPFLSERLLSSDFVSWIDEQKRDPKFTDQDFDAIVRRFDEWLPIYSNPEWFALRRRLILLAKWLPETRQLPTGFELAL